MSQLPVEIVYMIMKQCSHVQEAQSLSEAYNISLHKYWLQVVKYRPALLPRSKCLSFFKIYFLLSLLIFSTINSNYVL